MLSTSKLQGGNALILEWLYIILMKVIIGKDYCLQAYVNRYILENLFKATWCLCLGISITSLLIFLLCNHIQCIEICQFIQFCNWFTHNGFLLCLFNVAKLLNT